MEVLKQRDGLVMIGLGKATRCSMLGPERTTLQRREWCPLVSSRGPACWLSSLALKLEAHVVCAMMWFSSHLITSLPPAQKHKAVKSGSCMQNLGSTGG